MTWGEWQGRDESVPWDGTDNEVYRFDDGENTVVQYMTAARANARIAGVATDTRRCPRCP